MLQDSLVHALLPHLMTCLPLLPQALCDVSPLSYITVTAKAEGLNQRLLTVYQPTDHPVA